MTPTGSQQPRVRPGDRKAVGTINWLFAQVSGRVTGTTPPNLFLVLGRHRRLFRGWLRFAGRLMPGGTLPRRETELVILRVAHLRDCDYELEHHRRLAGRAGLTDTEVGRALDGADAPEWSDRERALLRAVDEMHHTGALTDPVWDELRRHLDERQAIELVLLAAHYQMLATTIAALRVPLDRPRRSRG
jgi:AhpD family alkylhydroperoxidase